MQALIDIITRDGGRSVFDYYGFNTDILGKKQPHNPLRQERTSSIELDYKNNAYLYYDFGTQQGGNAIQLIQHQNDDVKEIIARCYGDATTTTRRTAPIAQKPIQKNKAQWIRAVKTKALSQDDYLFWQKKTSLEADHWTAQKVQRIQNITVSDKWGIKTYPAPAQVYALLDSAGQVFQLYNPNYQQDSYPFNKKTVFTGKPQQNLTYFGQYDPKADKTLICEGLSDTLAALQAGYRSVITFGGTTQNTAIDKICATLPQINEQNALFLFDNDEAGKKAARKVQEKGFEAIHLPKLDGSHSQNDLCDYLRIYGLDTELKNTLKNCGAILLHYQQYISDNPLILRSILQDKAPTALIATTGAGKTTLVAEITRQVNQSGKLVALITPLQAITKQAQLPKSLTICQDESSIQDFTPDKNIITTFQSFKKLPILPENYVLIIDEVHELTKSHHNAHVLSQVSQYHKVITLTATYDADTQVLLAPFQVSEIWAQPQEKLQKNVQISHFSKKNPLQQLVEKIDNLARQGKKVLLFSQNKNYNFALADVFKEQGAVQVNADTKQESYHKAILQGENPPILIATNVLSLGVNDLLYDVVISVYNPITTTPSDIVQQFGRLRHKGEFLLLLPEPQQEHTPTLTLSIEDQKKYFSSLLKGKKELAAYKTLIHKDLETNPLHKQYQNAIGSQDKDLVWQENNQQFQAMFERIFQNSNVKQNNKPKNQDQLLQKIQQLYAQVGVQAHFQTIKENPIQDQQNEAQSMVEKMQQEKQNHLQQIKNYCIEQKQQGIYDLLNALLSILPKQEITKRINHFLFDKPSTQDFPISLNPHRYSKEYQKIAHAAIKSLKNIQNIPLQELIEWIFSQQFETLYNKQIHYQNLLNYQPYQVLQNTNDDNALRETFRNRYLLESLALHLKPMEEVEDKIKAAQNKMILCQTIKSSEKNSKQLAAELNIPSNTIRSIRKRYHDRIETLTKKIEKLKRLPYQIDLFDLLKQLNCGLKNQHTGYLDADYTFEFSLKEIKQRLSYFQNKDLSALKFANYTKLRSRKATLYLSVAKPTEPPFLISIKKECTLIDNLQHPFEEPPNILLLG